MTTSPLTVEPFQPGDERLWEQFVSDHPDGTVFHRLAWSRAVMRAYGHRPHHLIAWDEERIDGVLPMMLCNSRLVGRVLVSVPYATYGGLLAANDVARDALLAEADRLGREWDAKYVELRQRDAVDCDWATIDRYDTFRIDLPDNPDEILPRLPKKARAAVRHAATDLTTDVGPQYLDDIYRLYAITLRRLGSPNYRKRLFTALADEFGDDAVCLVVRDGETPVAGVVSYVFRDELVAYFSGSVPSLRGNNASNLMYCALMEHAVRMGLKVFDFNRTRRDNAGPHAFKRHMGFTPDPLHYRIKMLAGGEPPNLSPSSSKFATAIRIWKKLPLCVTRPAGALVTKWIP